MIITFFAVFSVAGAASSEEIRANIQQAREKQDEAHQIAEYIRSFGESDTHPAIQFAKEKWSEQASLLTDLYQEYNDAVEQETREREQQEKGTYLGRFRISHYCPCVTCNGGSAATAVGARLTPWYTAAVDPSVIRLNSTIYIEGYGAFKAQDTGGAIRGNRIDICVSNHAEAYRLGVVYRDVYIQ